MQPANEIIFYDFDEFRVDVAEHRLLKNGKPLALTQKAFSVLLVLVENTGSIVEKEKIISAAWEDNAFVEESNLSQYVYMLRKALGGDSQGNSYIETITRRGFRFTAQVKPVTRESATTAASMAVAQARGETLNTAAVDDVSPAPHESALNTAEKGSVFETASEHEKVTNETEKFARAVPAAAAAAPAGSGSSYRDRSTAATNFSKNRRSAALRFSLIALLFLGLVLVATVYQRGRVASPAASTKIKSIAVLPFRTAEGESGGDSPGGGGGGDNSRRDEKPGLGIADAIITRLNKSKKFQVRSTSGVSNLTDQPAVDARHVGRELAVDAVLEGTVQRDNVNGGNGSNDRGRMRVTAQLTNVADGKPLWIENYDEPVVGDIFTMQDTVSEKIAQSLEEKF